MQTLAMKEDSLLEQSKPRIIKNATILSMAIMLHLSAKFTCAELQSSINIKDGLGVYAEEVRTFVGIFASIILPTLFVNKIGLKHTITIGLAITALYYIANFYPTFGSMVPAAVISTAVSAPLWPAKAFYLAILADQWSKASGTKSSSTMSFTFGFFYAFYYCGFIWGNAASYFILVPKNLEEIPPANATQYCGLYFCDWEAFRGNTNFDRPPDREIYILFGVFIGLTLFAALVAALFMDPLGIPKSDETIASLVIKPLRATIQPKHLLLLPLNIVRGVTITFLTTEYTKSFVSCAWGIHNIGLIMISFGIVCGSMSLLFGRIVRHTGRVPLFVTCLLCHVLVAAILVFWKANVEEKFLFFLVPVLHGVCNAVWESQVAALYALMFPVDREVIFSLYTIYEAVGGFIARSYSVVLCTQYKLLMFMIFVLIGFSCYITAEFKYLRKLDTPKKTDVDNLTQ